MLVEPAVDKAQLLAGMIPDLPNFPSWPSSVLHYDSSCGHYWLSETDVDRILDYAENRLPVYEYDLDTYRQQIDIIKRELQKHVSSF